MYLLIGALHAIPVFVVGRYTCSKLAILVVAILSAAIGIATGNPAYMGVDLVCVAAAYFVVLDATATQRATVAAERKALRDAKKAAARAAATATATGNGDASLLWGVGIALVLGLVIVAGRNKQPQTTETGAALHLPAAQIDTASANLPMMTASSGSNRTTNYGEPDPEAEEAWEKMLAEEEAERQKRYNFLSATLPESFERSIEECDLRKDEIEAWVCRDRFVARTKSRPTPLGASVSEEAPPRPAAEIRPSYMTPDTRRTRHNGQLVGSAPRAIYDSKECLRLEPSSVVADCLRHFP